MSLKFDRDAAEHLKNEWMLYTQELKAIIKELSDIMADKNYWADDQKRAFNAHLQTIKDNLAALEQSQTEFVDIYSKQIKELVA